MPRVLTAALVLAVSALLLVGPKEHEPPVVEASTTPAAYTYRTIWLDGVPVRWTPVIRQVITVKRTSKTWARVSFWAYVDGRWLLRTRATMGRTGYGGLVDPDTRRQGTGTTPVGTYPIWFTFGNTAHQAGWDLEFRRVADHHYWVQDNASIHYNRWRSRHDAGFRWWLPASDPDSSERLADYPRQYEMAAVIGFNYANPVRHRGAGIFLHVNGSGATAGCVSTPRWFMADAMARMHPTMHPHIAIGY